MESEATKTSETTGVKGGSLMKNNHLIKKFSTIWGQNLWKTAKDCQAGIFYILSIATGTIRKAVFMIKEYRSGELMTIFQNTSSARSRKRRGF
jgi:hypothetical protein